MTLILFPRKVIKSKSNLKLFGSNFIKLISPEKPIGKQRVQKRWNFGHSTQLWFLFCPWMPEKTSFLVHWTDNVWKSIENCQEPNSPNAKKISVNISRRLPYQFNKLSIWKSTLCFTETRYIYLSFEVSFSSPKRTTKSFTVWFQHQWLKGYYQQKYNARSVHLAGGTNV